MTTLAVFNNKGGVGKTSITWHLAFALARQDVPVLVVDADPQANLTATLYDDDTVEAIWQSDQTVFGMVQPVIRGLGDVRLIEPKVLEENLTFIPGDMRLARFESLLSDSWPRGADGNEADLRQLTAPWRAIESAATAVGARIILLDLGPNLGSLTRSYIVMADHILVPAAPDLFSLQGLRNLGPVLRDWRGQWTARRDQAARLDIDAPQGIMNPLGYVLSQHGVYGNRPVAAFSRWMQRFPAEFRSSMLPDEGDFAGTGANATPGDDPCFLGRIRNYRSLMPMAMEARKPVFDLRPADGAIGAHMAAVQECRVAYRDLAGRVLEGLARGGELKA